jgi:restriction system protein
MATRYHKKPQYGIGTIDRIALIIFAGAALAGWQALTSNISQFVTVAIVLTVLSAIFGLIMLWYFHHRDQQRLRAIAIADVDKMTGVEFEQYVGKLLTHQGYKVSFTKTSGDYGVDIIATKGAEKVAVQVKRYSGSVGRAAVSAAVAGKLQYQCNRTMVVTSNYFTPEAKQLAYSNFCKLINREKLIDWILEYQGSTPLSEAEQTTTAKLGYQLTEKHHQASESGSL